MDLVALKNEIQNDPATMGYAGKPHDQIADLLNKPVRTPNRETISGGLLASCIDREEYALLSPADKAYITMLTAANELTLLNSLLSDIRGALSLATQSKNKFNANITRKGSRAEELGFGAVTASDVADALR